MVYMYHRFFSSTHLLIGPWAASRCWLLLKKKIIAYLFILNFSTFIICSESNNMLMVNKVKSIDILLPDSYEVDLALPDPYNIELSF